MLLFWKWLDPVWKQKFTSAYLKLTNDRKKTFQYHLGIFSHLKKPKDTIFCRQLRKIVSSGFVYLPADREIYQKPRM
jgi:hypothetical protein